MGTLIENVTSSVWVFAQSVADDIEVHDPNIDPQMIDWEMYSNIEELPDASLFGPTAITVTEYDKEVEVTFALAASTYRQDENLFYLRAVLGIAFERMRPEKQFLFYDSDSSSELSVFQFTPGTLLAPMTRPMSGRGLMFKLSVF